MMKYIFLILFSTVAISAISQENIHPLDSSNRFSFNVSLSQGVISFDNVNPFQSYVELPFREQGFDSTTFADYQHFAERENQMISFNLNYQLPVTNRVWVNFGVELVTAPIGGRRTGPSSGGSSLYYRESYYSFAGQFGIGYDFLPSPYHDLTLNADLIGGQLRMFTKTYYDGRSLSGEPSEQFMRSGTFIRAQARLIYTRLYDNGFGFSLGAAYSSAFNYSPVRMVVGENTENYARNSNWPKVSYYEFEETSTTQIGTLNPETHRFNYPLRLEFGVLYAF